MKTIRWMMGITICVLMALSMMAAAGAEGYYPTVEAEVPVGGTGTFYLKEAGASDDDPVASVTAEGTGVMTLRFVDPGNYAYELYSRDPVNKQRYDVMVTVVTAGADGRELEPWVVICEKGSDRKLPAAYYPITIVNPPISKEMIGGGALGLRQTFVFEFRAVSCTVPELEGKMPMPPGSAGQRKIIQIVGPGEVEAGDMIMERAGTYVYEFTEHNMGAEDFYYDESVYTVIYEVTEGEHSLEAEMTVLKNRDEYSEEQIRFTNYYGKLPEHGPKTGDEFRAAPYVAALAVSALGMTTVAFWLLTNGRRREKN